MKTNWTVYRLVLFLTLSLIILNLSAQNRPDPVSYNLNQLLKIAEENNRDIQVVRLELQKANQQLELQKSVFLPKVDAFADYYWYWGGVPVFVFPENEGKILSGGTSNGAYPVSIGQPNNLLTGVSLSQRLWDFSFLNSGKSKEVFSAIESDKIKEKKEQLFYDVAVCYYEISKLAAKKDFIDFNISRIDRMVGILKIQLNNQMTDSLQLIDLEYRKAELLLSKSEFLSGMQRKTNYLKMLVGLPDSINLDYSSLDYAPVVEKIDTTANGVEGSTQLSLLKQAQNMNDLSQKKVQSEYLPTLDFKFNFLWNAQSQNLGFFSSEAFGNNISTLGLKLDIPIYHGAEKKKKMQELEIGNSILDLQEQKLKEGYQLQYTNAIKELEFKTARFRHQQEITQLKKRYLDKANKQYEQGILPIKDLLEAQSGLLETQMKTAETLFDVKLAELDYYKWSNQILTRFE
jgi:outer membrane protein TolC